MSEIEIAGRKIGENHPPVVIAEIGINHGGSLDLAIEMVDSAIDAGVEIIKHQTHVIEDEMSEEAKGIVPGNSDKNIHQIMTECALNEEDEFKLFKYVKQKDLIFMSSPFSREAAKRLERFGIDAIKIGSGECNNYPLIKFVAKMGMPVVMSTGMNTIETIRPSVEILKNNNIPLALLHCTNVYPTPPELIRLDAITVLKNEFPDTVVGLSDHSLSNYPCLGAVALGASILERHYTDTMNREGPDICCSMDPRALKELIEGSKIIHQSKGFGKGPIAEEEKTIAFAFASVVTTREIEAGEILTEENLWVRRPGGGDFSVNDYDALIGKKAISKIAKNVQLRKSDVAL